MEQVGKKNIRKYQAAASIEDLFRAADAINPYFQEKAKVLASTLSGRHMAASIKSEVRSLEKVFRVYSGDFKKLADLVRTTIVFSGIDAVTSMNECLIKISLDTELEVVHAQDEKIRINIHKNTQSGYRDVQLCLRLKSPASLELGLDVHLCEMQLHLDEMHALKTETGHRNYIACRNLRGN
jgi:hypothetical protein